MHPHWNATEEDRPVRVTDVNAPAEVAAPRSSVRYASRLPGAAMGIALFLVAGFVIFKGVGTFTAQVTDPSQVIRITAEGLSPTPLIVQAGDTIEWKNDDTIPHVLSFLPSLPGAQGDIPELPSMFQGTSQRVTLSATAAEGTYTYYSQTSGTINGQILISDKTAQSSAASKVSAAAAAPTSAASKASVAPVIPPINEPTIPSETIPDPMLPNETGFGTIAQPSAAIPQNPFTVGAPNQAGQVPAANMQGSVTQHTPTSTSETGAALWIAVAGSLLLLVIVTKKQLWVS